MPDSRDPAIKLFGKTIALPSAGDEGGGDEEKGYPNKEEISSEIKDKEQESPQSEEKSEPVTSSADETQKPNSCFDDQETASEKDSKAEEQQNDSADNSSQEKTTLKKPDKILPCPRCNSMDTKFCYYNNYNVNQPRHFCKNCQRYWTAGGTMRNVPVGAGRRKNKTSAANHYRHLTMTDAAALQATPDSMHHPALKPNGTVLSFGSDAPLCESMASVLNLSENTMKNCNRNEFHHRIEEQMEEQSSGSSATASNLTDEGTGAANLQEPAIRNSQGFPPHLPYISGSPWPYLWSPPPPPPPGAAPTAPFCGLSFQIPIYPATPYWGCSTWGIPWLAPPLASPSLANGSSGPNSPTLGKHSRDEDVLQRSTNNSSSDRGESNQEKCLWIPKTLRINDPEEAAKSSIWATMGFKNDKADGIRSRGGLFKSFQTKAELNNHKVETSQLLHANPAALSRSVNFQESS